MMDDSKKKRVLIVISNLKTAGAQKVVEQLAMNINKTRYIVNVLVIEKPSNSAFEKNLDNHKISVCYLHKSSGFHARIIKQVNQYISKFKPNIIHTHVSGWVYVFPSAIIQGIKVLHTIHSRPHRQEAMLATRWLIGMLYHLNIIIPIAISDVLKKEASHIYLLSPKRIEVVYNPVDYYSFSEKPKQVHPGICAVNVARFNKVKNQLFLIEAFAKAREKNKDLRLVLAGEGELFMEAKSLAEKLRIEEFVEFTGNIDDVPALLARCDIFVLPSLTEGLPMSILEAEAAGLPIIASRVGGVVDIVSDNGYLIDVNDKDGLVNAILDIAESEEIRNRMGAQSREIARQYAVDIIARRYEMLYDKYGK